MSNALRLLPLCLLPFVTALDVAVFRVSPDAGVTVKPITRLGIEFNQPIETSSGEISVSFGGKQIWTTPVVSRQVWVRGASVEIDVPSSVISTSGEYSISVPANAFISSDEGLPSPAIPATTWSFSVSPSGPVFHNSTLPSTPRWFTEVHMLISNLNAQKVNATITHLSSYYNRFFQSQDGVNAAKWMKSQFSSIAHRYNRPDVVIKTFKHAWKMPSLIVSIPASQSEDDLQSNNTSNEVVIIGAHLDSINRQNWTINVESGAAPGADDDASGVAILLELFRVLIRYQPVFNRQIQFHIYSGEEEGLYGSQDIAAAYQRSNINVAAMLQLDQCAYVKDPNNEYIGIFVDHTDPTLTTLMQELVKTYTKLPYQMSDESGRADSDFHSFTNNGFRAAYIAEGNVDDIVYGNAKHTRHDVMNTIMLSHAMQIARAALGFLIEVGRM